MPRYRIVIAVLLLTLSAVVASPRAQQDIHAGLINLATMVTGTLGAGNGGSGQSSYTKGDLLCASGSTTLTKLGVGSNTNVLTADSTQTCGAKWAAPSGGGASITQGGYASLPGTCTTNDVYFFTDAVYQPARCSATNTWSFFLDGKLATPPGPLSGWTGVNTGSNWTQADANGAIAIRVSTVTGQAWRLLTKTQPSTPYTITAAWKAIPNYASAALSGLYFYDGTKLMGIEVLSESSTTGDTIRVEKITNVTTDGSTAANVGAVPSGIYYARISNSGTTLAFSYSVDGVVWYSLFSESVGTFITPTTYGFGAFSQLSSASTPNYAATLLSLVIS